MRICLALLTLLPSLMLAACSSAHYPINPPLHESRLDTGYAIRNLKAPNNSDGLVLLTSFSGGGHRAAALAFAVLEQLRDTSIVWDGRPRRLLDELDFISAVSGGSLAAAAYAWLGPDAFFPRFEQSVLRADLQSALVSRFFSPSGLWRQSSPRFGRSELLQELLDERLFGGATFADLPRRRPMVFINATEMRYGERFEFSQDQFDHLCADLDGLPLSRAVSASMAVPILLSPVTLWNHREGCGVLAPRFALASRASEHRYVHLVDGGLNDNTGVSTPLEIINARGGLIDTTRQANFRGVRHRVFVIVNAAAQPEQEDDSSADVPSLLRQLWAAVNVPIDRSAEGSLRALHDTIQRWRQELAQASDAQLGDLLARETRFTVIEINLGKGRDHPRWADLQRIPSLLRLGAEDLELLRDFVRWSLARNPDWQALLGELQPAVPASN